LRRGAVVALVSIALVVAVVTTAIAYFIDWLPEQASEERQGIDLVIWVTVGICIFVFAVVAAVSIYAGVKFRVRPDDESDGPPIHGHTGLEILWTAVPTVFVAVVAVLRAVVLAQNDRAKGTPMRIDVLAQQFAWQFTYPERRGVKATSLYLPVGRSAKLTLTSRDVIHSFWVPKLNGKRDVVPGREHNWTIEADLDDAGQLFEGQCVEFCGLSHANMRLRVKVLAPDDFAQWLSDQQEDAAEPTTELAREGLNQFRTLCASCHQIDGVNEQRRAAQKSGAAPNLTHVASRSRFAGALFDFNRNELEDWLRDPPAKKPMLPDDDRGMPNLNLTEEQIDQLVSYLLTLK
jgi:cytochrome c oxidase subunit II